MDTNDKKGEVAKVGEVNIKISAGESFSHGFFFAIGAFFAVAVITAIITAITAFTFENVLKSTFRSFNSAVNQPVQRIPNL